MIPYKYEILRDKSDNVQDGYTENCKTLLRETKEDISKRRAYGPPMLEVSMLSCRSLQDQPRVWWSSGGLTQHAGVVPAVTHGHRTHSWVNEGKGNWAVPRGLQLWLPGASPSHELYPPETDSDQGSSPRPQCPEFLLGAGRMTPSA